MAIDYRIQVPISIFDEDTGTWFNDALYYTPTEFAAMTEQQIQDAMQQRFDNWKSPPIPEDE